MLQRLLDAHLFWRAVDQGKHVDAKGSLQRRQPVQLIQDHILLHILAQLDDDAHTVSVRFVVQISDAVDDLLPDQRSDLFDHGRLVDLIRDLIDNDAFLAIVHLFDLYL